MASKRQPEYNPLFMVKKASSLLKNPQSEDQNSDSEDSSVHPPPKNQGGDSSRRCRTTRSSRLAPKNPPKGAKGRAKRSSNSKQSPECLRHSNRPFQFICLSRTCLKELCSMCILEHRDHVEEVKPLEEVMEEHAASIALLRTKDLKEQIVKMKEETFRELDVFAAKMTGMIFESVNRYKEHLITSDETICATADHIVNFQEHFRNFDESNPSFLSEDSIGLVRQCIQNAHRYHTNSYVIEEGIILDQFERLLDAHIHTLVNGYSFNTTLKDVPKYLHWFEWEKKELHLFDIVENSFHVLKLITSFKTAQFCRSIMLPHGVILLLGGQDSTYGALKDVYQFEVTPIRPDVRAVNLAPMVCRKFDFSVCFHDGFVYVLGGKDSDTQIVTSCERYDIKKNTWSIVAPMTFKRSGSCAAVVKETAKIYVFGGRTEGVSGMVPEIEEYSIATNIWKTIALASPALWAPLENSAAVQINSGQILIFGGSDIRMEDSSASYIFSPADAKLTRTGPLKKAQVFVNQAFVTGTQVFIPGNHYYLNSRTIHRFDTKKLTWNILK